MAPWLLLLTGFTLASARTLGKPSPIAAVRSAQEELAAAAKEDEAANGKAGCFCQTNLAEKQQTVENMQQQLTQLSHDIDETTARISSLDVEVKMHSEEIATSSSSLSTAEALRQKDLAKFTEEETSHSVSIDQMKAALGALDSHGSVDAALIAVGEVTKLTAGRAQKGQMIQLQRSLRGKSSPEVVTGVLKQMMGSFSRNLQQMRDDEIEAKSRHEDIVAAKTQEIRSQKKQALGKQQRLAKAKVQVEFNKQIQERSGKLLDANVNILNSLKQICQKSDDSFAERQETTGSLTEALSSAQAELAGTMLLSISQHARDDGSEKICAVFIAEKSWMAQARAACKQAQEGTTASKAAAADAIESLESDIHEAEEEAGRKQDDCLKEIQSSQDEIQMRSKEDSAEANFVGSEQQAAEEQIQELTAQSDHADKAKADYEQVVMAQQKAAQTLRMATAHSNENLKYAASHAGQPAVMKINEAMSQSEKLQKEADGFAADLQSKSQELGSLCDNVRMTAGKAMIPLRLMKADSEEDAITIKEDSETHAKAKAPKCDAGKLSGEVSKLKSYRALLGKAAESLAWETLR